MSLHIDTFPSRKCKRSNLAANKLPPRSFPPVCDQSTLVPLGSLLLSKSLHITDTFHLCLHLSKATAREEAYRDGYRFRQWLADPEGLQGIPQAEQARHPRGRATSNYLQNHLGTCLEKVYFSQPEGCRGCLGSFEGRPHRPHQPDEAVVLDA